MPSLASSSNSVVMGPSVQEKKMHYPVMTEKYLADRWQVRLKTLRRWRLDGEGPVWHKLFRQVRYHDADILEFEQRSAQHLMTMLGIKRDFKPEVPEAAQGHRLQQNSKEITEPGQPLHLSTADPLKVGFHPWLNIQSARWSTSPSI
jgi:hypothetical protein